MPDSLTLSCSAKGPWLEACFRSGEVSIFINGEGDPMVVPLAAGAGVPAPMSAPPFAKHSLKNTGTTTVKLLFFEMKQ